MPELPEVETMRRCVTEIVGRRIRDVQRVKSRLHPIQISPRIADFRRRVKGARITAVGRVGKRVVVELDSEDRIIFEPRMSGLVLLADPPDREHLRLVFQLTGRPVRRLLFWNQRGLGVVQLASPRQFADSCGPDKLGPDALEVSCKVLRQRLGASGREIKVALLDQKAVAGIGNLYASEILHRARIHPQQRCNELRPAQWNKLHAHMGQLLRQAIVFQGSTLSDGTYRVARDRSGSFQCHHRVYQRAGQQCVQCGKADVIRVVQAQRSTFFCPVCQRANKGASI